MQENQRVNQKTKIESIRSTKTEIRRRIENIRSRNTVIKIEVKIRKRRRMGVDSMILELILQRSRVKR